MYKFSIIVITWLALHPKVFTDMYWILWNRNKNTIQYNTTCACSYGTIYRFGHNCVYQTFMCCWPCIPIYSCK